MTHEPEQEHTRGEEPIEPELPPGEIVTGPGGADHSGLRRVWERQPVRARAVIAAATVGVLAVGGTVAYAATSGSSGSSEGAVPAAASAPSGSASPDRDGHRFGFRGGVHGEETVKDPDSGEWVVRIWQRGTVEKADGDQVTVKSEDGASWTWTVDDDTKVLGADDADALKKGDTVFVSGRLSGSDRSATRVFSGDLGSGGLGSGDSENGRHGMPGHGPGHWHSGGPSAEGTAS
ncbi:DUF5666 domain-containing protein [Streptomyces sp. NPDC047072]|uniref:DUF5666 domain-containing protein n=1 Tax=Streptomyces sp. NPDC047072 TaxID=3154809 RepID=UPI0033E5A56B